MRPYRRFNFLDKIFKCKTRIQLPEPTSKYFLSEGYIKEVEHEETWSQGKFTCVFHELTEKGKKFHKEYKEKQ